MRISLRGSIYTYRFLATNHIHMPIVSKQICNFYSLTWKVPHLNFVRFHQCPWYELYTIDTEVYAPPKAEFKTFFQLLKCHTFTCIVILFLVKSFNLKEKFVFLDTEKSKEKIILQSYNFFCCVLGKSFVD